MLKRHALIAEVLAELVHLLEPAHDAPLEVQLGGDAQKQIATLLVVVCDEGSRRGTAVDRLQRRCLDLDEPAGVEEAAHARDGAGPHDELAAYVFGCHEVEVPLPVAGLRVGETGMAIGRRAQRLGEHLH